MSGLARQASRSVLHLRPPLAARAASFAALRPSNTGAGTRRSPLARGSPPSLRIALKRAQMLRRAEPACCALDSDADRTFAHRSAPRAAAPLLPARTV